MTYRQAAWDTKLVFEMTGESDFSLPPFRDAENLVPPEMIRKSLYIPNLAERDVVKHYINLSQMSYGVDNGTYPLGSCTMKYNPKYADLLASLPTVTEIHPLQDEEGVQGALQLMYELERALCAISGMDAVSLQPAAGAQGEFTGMLIARAYHQHKGQDRKEVILPDSAHGTNPASAAMAGFDVLEIPSNGNGCVDLKALENALSERTAAFMLTNPNTLGIFEENVQRIAEVVHQAGALLYYDGANLNAIMGHTSPGKMDFDIVHFNLHKTFATPHGGGGPGAGPVGVKKHLASYLPVPRIIQEEGHFWLDFNYEESIGKVLSFYGNFAVLVRAYAYILHKGGNGLKEVSDGAVLNANYLKDRLKTTYPLPYKELRKHEFVLSAKRLKEEKEVRALDLSKRILDFGVHSPTIYFPALVEEALMIEPTETETKETLDQYANVLKLIAQEDPETTRSAPHHTSVERVDEVQAAKDLILSWMSIRNKAALKLQELQKASGEKGCQLCSSLLNPPDK